MEPKDLYEILVREHAEILSVYLRGAVRDPALADDLFQETLIVACPVICQMRFRLRSTKPSLSASTCSPACTPSALPS